jgi:hypothetical protein
MPEASEHGGNTAQEEFREAGFRFGAVLVLTTAVLLFTIAAPDGDLTRAVSVLLTASMLLTVAVTSGAPPRVRRTSIAVVGLALVATTGLAGSKELPKTATLVTSGVMAALALPALSGGLVRLLRARGVTVQAVTGALAIYLLVAVVFTYAIGATAEASSEPYFVGAGKGSQSERAYFSVTVLSTTGLGDLTPATRAGRTLTVLEELIGQLYLVTVVALIVANVARGLRRAGEQPHP